MERNQAHRGRQSRQNPAQSIPARLSGKQLGNNSAPVIVPRWERALWVKWDGYENLPYALSTRENKDPSLVSGAVLV